MELGTMGNGGDTEDEDGGQERRDSPGDSMGLKGGKGNQGKGRYNGYGHQLALKRAEGKQGKGESKRQHKGKGNGKTGKGWRRRQKRKGPKA